MIFLKAPANIGGLFYLLPLSGGAVTLSLSKGACWGLPTILRQAQYDTITS
jgi:hypothetical protein